MELLNRLQGAWRQFLRATIALGLAASLAIAASGCGSPKGDVMESAEVLQSPTQTTQPKSLSDQLTEVPPPASIQELKPFLALYQPQVSFLSPQDGETLTEQTVSVRLQVRDLPTFKDAALGLGPHLHVFLDDQPYQAVYNPDEPLVFDNLAPGTHTLRAFASRPWHESFKNEGAFDQVTFNVFASSAQNDPDRSAPQLTYSRPQGSYGAEPIMLDFYLNNAPLHQVAQQDAEDDVVDWRLRCTINGESFVFDQWQPIYLTGFKPGQNWVKLELIDDQGTPIDNAFNTAVRLIEYQPGGDDGLSQLVRGEIPMDQARRLIDPDYVPAMPEAEAPATEEEVPETDASAETPEAAIEPEPIPEKQPDAEEAEDSAEVAPPGAVAPETTPAPDADQAEAIEQADTEPEASPAEETTVTDAETKDAPGQPSPSAQPEHQDTENEENTPSLPEAADQPADDSSVKPETSTPESAAVEAADGEAAVKAETAESEAAAIEDGVTEASAEADAKAAMDEDTGNGQETDAGVNPPEADREAAPQP